MTGSRDDDALERMVELAVRELPLRRAPRRLESRVLGELRLRGLPVRGGGEASQQWPSLARRSLIGLCAVLTGVTLLDAPWTLAPTKSLALLGRNMPPSWLDIGLAVGAMLYVTLFGLGAAAYRTLYLQPSNGR